MKFVVVYTISCIFLSQSFEIFTKNHYYDGLIKYLKEESKLHQVVFVLDKQYNKNDDPLMNSLITAVSSHFPSLLIKYNAARSKLSKLQIKLINRPRSTTLFVLKFKNDDLIEQLNRFLIKNNKLLDGSSKPRCLILNPIFKQFSKRVNINRTLDYFWQNQYLDITFLTYNQQPQVMLKPSINQLPILSQLNPFTGNYSTEMVSSKSQWFPNKLLNLHGYKLNFSCQPANDSSEEEYQKAIKFVKILSQKMNFEPQVTLFLIRKGKISFGKNKSEIVRLDKENKDKSKGINSELWLNVKSFYDEDIIRANNILILNLDSAKAVIPRTIKHTEEFKLSPEFWHMIVGTIGLITLIRLTAFLLNFKKTKWQTLNISQIILGMSTNQEPKKIPERIAFGSLVIACIAYTSYFYSVILDINFHPIPEISTLTELVKSPLIPRMEHALRRSTTHTIRAIQDLMKTSIQIPYGGQEYCLKELTNNQNVTCVINNAAHHVNTYELKNGEIDVKILPDAIKYSATTFSHRTMSPYIDRYNEIILKASEFGLLKDYYGAAERLHSNSFEPEIITKEKLLPILFFVLTIGYTFSIIAFLFEVIIGCKFWQEKILKRYNFIKRCIFVVDQNNL